MTPLPGPAGRLWHRLATQARRRRIADGLIAGARRAAQLVDPDVADAHLLRRERLAGSPFPMLTDPCVPAGTAYVTQVREGGPSVRIDGAPLTWAMQRPYDEVADEAARQVITKAIEEDREPHPVGSVITGAQARKVLPDGVVLLYIDPATGEPRGRPTYRVVGRPLKPVRNAGADRGVVRHAHYRIESLDIGDWSACVAECTLTDCDGCTCRGGGPCPHCERVGEVYDAVD